jgi:hypothetical protein
MAFFQNTSLIWFPTAIRPTFLITDTARTRVRIYMPENKPLLWSLESPQEFRACGFSAPVQWTRVRSDKTLNQIATNTHYNFFTACCKFRCLCNKRQSICLRWEPSHCRISRLISARSPKFVVRSLKSSRLSSGKGEGRQSQLSFMLHYYITRMRHDLA